jgi:tRNA modification GTPase
MTFARDTIVAVSSAVGAAARMIVRLSGTDAAALAGALCCELPDGGAAARVILRVRGMGVPAWVYRFVAPRSYTGEDLVELHLPGNPLLARILLDELIAGGARPAEPGEFTARAYFNGRIDLTAAEGVAATIAARNEEELAAARQLMAGELARRLRPVMDQLAETLALVEAGIDFSDEDITFLDAAQVHHRAGETIAALRELLESSARFERLSHEPRVVLAGRPNAGKSTLLNALCGIQRSVVSPTAGTTRDVIWAEAVLGRGIVRIVDAAGFEEHPPPASDTSPAAHISRKMHEHAMRALEEGDIVLLLRDITDPRPLLRLSRTPDLIVLTKVDLAEGTTTAQIGGVSGEGVPVVAVSARTGSNLDELRARLERLAFGAEGAASGLALNARHRQALQEALAALEEAQAAALAAGPEVVALGLREALDALGRILGHITPDDVLGRVFATFCIGK